MNSSEDVHANNVSSATFITVGVVMSVLFVLALIENISVLIVYKNNPDLHTKSNLWIISVIICDVLIAFSTFPLLIVASFSEEYIFGRSGCKWDGFIVTFLGCSSIYLFAGLSIYRYAIMINYGRAKNITETQICLRILLCFAFGLGWAVSPLIGWGSFSLEGMHISCAPNWRSQDVSDLTFTSFMYVFVLLIPLLLIGYSYAKIILKIWREKCKHSALIQERRVRRDIKVTITVALTIVSFLVCWTPYAIVTLCEAYLSVDLYSVSPMLVQLPCLMAKTTCIWNPLVFISHSNDFRRAFTRQFPFLKRMESKQLKKETLNTMNKSDNEKAIPLPLDSLPEVNTPEDKNQNQKFNIIILSTVD